MHISSPYPKHTRFAHYDRSQPAYVFQRYPLVAKNDDGSIITVHTEDQHKALAKVRWTPDPENFAGAKTAAQADHLMKDYSLKSEWPNKIPALPKGPEVPVIDAALKRNGAKLRSLDGEAPAEVVPGPAPEELVQEAG